MVILERGNCQISKNRENCKITNEGETISGMRVTISGMEGKDFPCFHYFSLCTAVVHSFHIFLFSSFSLLSPSSYSPASSTFSSSSKTSSSSFSSSWYKNPHHHQITICSGGWPTRNLHEYSQLKLYHIIRIWPLWPWPSKSNFILLLE